MGDSGSSSPVVLLEFCNIVRAVFTDVALRNGINYFGSKHLLSTLRMASGVAKALALTALDVGYVE